MHINQKYVLKIYICRFMLKEFTNNPMLFLLFSTLDTALCDKFVSDLRQVSGPLHPALRGVLNLLITAVWCHLQYFSYIEVVSFIVEETGVLRENHKPNNPVVI
jgi:hypothetical protein